MKLKLAEVVMTGERGYAQNAVMRHHLVHADEPATQGGTDTGPTPYELLLYGSGRLHGDHFEDVRRAQGLGAWHYGSAA